MQSGRTHTPSTTRYQGVPGIYLLLLCDVMRGFGFEDEQIILDLGVTRSALLQPDSRISVSAGHIAARRAVALAGERGLGLAFARTLKVTLHGSLGLMALSSPSVGAALDAAVRYLALRAPFLAATYEVREEIAEVRLEASAGVAELEVFVMETALVALAFMMEQLLGEMPDGVAVHMPVPAPPYYARYRAELSVPIIYNSDRWCLRGPAAAFDRAPRLADPAVAALAREQCELEYQRVFAGQKSLPQRVTDHLRMCEEGEPLPALERMADWLHLSARTFKRRLQEEGVTYRELLEAELYARARHWLAEPRLGISEIAYRLGYTDVSNFSRAFKRWTGQTPRDYRQSLPSR